MPDLTVETFETCCSNDNWVKHVPGPTGAHTVTYGRMYGEGPYEYGYRCTCKAYKYSKATLAKTCKHIDKVRHLRCSWSQFIEGGHSEGGKCPKCDGPVTVERIAV